MKAAPAKKAKSPAEPPGGWRSKLPGAQCAGCPAENGQLIKPTLATGKTRLVIVVDKPRSADADESALLRGTDGHTIGVQLRKLAVKQADCHVTAAIACTCRKKAEKEARKRCKPRLDAELAVTEGAPVVAFDNLAIASTVGKAVTPVMKWRGFVWQTPERLVLPMQTPHEIRAHAKWMPMWESDWARVGRMLEAHEAGEKFVPLELQPWHTMVFPQSLPELRKALSKLRAGPTLFDVETVGLGAATTGLVCFGLSDGWTTVVVQWAENTAGKGLYWGELSSEVTRLINAHWQRAGARLVAHNGIAFDFIVGPRYGLEVPQEWDDTLLMSHAVANHLPKNLAWVVTMAGLDVPPWKQLESRNKDMRELMFYNGRDCLYNIRAYWVLREKFGDGLDGATEID